MKRAQRRQLTILFATLFLVMVGLGIIIPILPFYAESMGATATHLGVLFAVYALMQFLFSPYWGRYSDRVGRRPVLMIGLIGLSISLVLFGLAWELWMLYVARVMGGVLSSAILPTVRAYIADSTTPEQRGQGMGMLGAAAGLGMIFGPVIGSFLGEWDPEIPFYVTAGLGALMAGFAAVFLPESLRPRSQGEAERLALPREGDVSRNKLTSALRSPVGPILILGFLVHFAFANLLSTLALFLEAKLGFGETQMGFVFMAMMGIMAPTQGLAVGRAIQRWGEGPTIRAGLVLGGLGFLGLLLAFDLTSLLALSVLIGIGLALLMPSINSLTSKRSPEEEQGAMLGVLNSYQSLGRVAGPILGGATFDLLGYGSPYIVAGALFGLLVPLSGRLLGTGAKRSLPVTEASSPHAGAEPKKGKGAAKRPSEGSRTAG